MKYPQLATGLSTASTFSTAESTAAKKTKKNSANNDGIQRWDPTMRSIRLDLFYSRSYQRRSTRRTKAFGCMPKGLNHEKWIVIRIKTDPMKSDENEEEEGAIR